MSILNRQVLNGVVVIFITTCIIGSYTLYNEISANTLHRLNNNTQEAKINKISESLIRIETNQAILLKKYDNEINN